MPDYQSLRRWCVCAAMMFLAVSATAASGVTIGNVSSYGTAGQDVTFNISDGSKVQISVLTADMIRVRIAPGGVFGTNVSQAVVTTSWPAATFNVSDGGSDVTITTDAVKLVVKKTPFVLECRDLDNTLVVTDDPVRRIQWDGGRTQVYKTTQVNEKYVGLGWRALGLVRNGSRFIMNNVARYEPSETFYAGVPIWYGMRNGRVYGMFFDDTSWGEIDMTTTGSGYMSFKNTGGMAEYYYFAGPTIADVLDDFTELTGRPYMPPRWSLGYHQCRWSYTPQSQVLDIAAEFRNRNIPCDVIYLDIDYMPGGHALTFNPSTFPNPGTMNNTLHSQGFKVVANISPFLFADDPKYGTAVGNNYVLRKADNTVLNGWHDYWFFVGGAGTGTMAFLDFSRTTTRNWWQSQHTSFLNLGIDGIWNDLNEPDELGGAWPSDVKYNFDGNPVDHSKTSTQYALLQTELSYDILASHYPDRRPFVLSRGGYAGIQRYSAVWSGDNTSDWGNDYQRNIPMGLSMSISGNPHNGHDIGGFFGHPDFNDAPSNELYARWMQSGVFNPFCRQHHDGWGNNDPARPFLEPWRFGTQVENISRDFIELRYRLMPYIYSLFHEAHTSGAPVQRPTLYDFPDDSTTLTQDYDFMFGPYMLVSPVTTPGATTWNTYLPDGPDWIDWWDDTLYAGGQIVQTSTPLERLPIFVRGGAIIPMAPVSQYEGHTPLDVLTLELYPVNETSEFTMYEDDGISWDYLSNDYAETAYTMSGIGDSFTLDIGARVGNYVPTTRDYLVKVHRWPGHTLVPSVNDVALTEYATYAEFDNALAGYYLDETEDILYARFDDTGGDLTFTFGGTPIPDVPGDFEPDGDVDQDDFGVEQGCLAGSGQPIPPGCEEADLNGDGSVDQADVLIFFDCMSGAGIIGDPHCAD